MSTEVMPCPSCGARPGDGETFKTAGGHYYVNDRPCPREGQAMNTAREPGCKCDREVGDSECPLHTPFPCPFCGNDETVEFLHLHGEEVGVAVHCGGCEARGPREDDMDGAAWAWNCAKNRQPKILPDRRPFIARIEGTKP